MSISRIRGGSSIAALLLSSSAVFADVTHQDVWGVWRSYLVGTGYAVNASESIDGDTLTVSDLRIEMDLPEDQGSMTMALGKLGFTELGDGTVRIDLPPTMPMQFKMNDGENTVDATVTAGFTGLNMIASGGRDEITYNYIASEMSIALTELLTDGTPEADVNAVATLSNVLGHSAMSGADTDMIGVDQKMSAKSIAYDIAFVDENDKPFSLKGAVNGVDFGGEGKVPMVDANEDPAELFRNGFLMEGRLSQRGSSMSMNGADEAGPFQIDATTKSGAMDFKIGDGAVSYGGGADGVTMNMLSAAIPLPLSFELGEYGFTFLMPLMKADTPQPFDLSVKMVDLVVPDMLWGMFDPAGKLSRAPATVAVDFGGTATLFEDLIDEDIAESDKVPGEVNTIALEDLEVSVAGARLTGQGGFTLDNTDLETFDGMPRPEGSVKLNLKGGIALIQTLSEMGLLPQDQAMGAQMMLGMFARPIAEDDLESIIEINANGNIFANGQQLQ